MLLFLNLGAGEIAVIALFVLMFFGSKEIPNLMRGLGRGMREFKDAMNGIEREVRSVVNMDEVKNMVNMDDEKKQIPPTTSIPAPIDPPKDPVTKSE
jgi:sec-independent protein translocase protein TatA